MCKWEPLNILGKGPEIHQSPDPRWQPLQNCNECHQVKSGSVCFQAVHVVHKTLLYRQLRMILKDTLYLPFDNYRLLPRRPSYCWPDLVSRIRFSQLPAIQTDSAVFSVFTIWQLDFPPGVPDTAIVGPGLCLLVIAVSSAVWAEATQSD